MAGNMEQVPMAGFQFDNVKRNAFLASKGFPVPKTTKTGTTICGAVFDGGVVLGADTRSTSGDIVADKNCMKLHQLAPNMLCCGAGTAADCNKVCDMIASQLKLLRLNWNDRQVRVKTANTLFKQMLFRYQGYIGAYLVLAGADAEGGHLFGINAHGSTDKVPYTALGSGMLAAMSVLEVGWKPAMTEDEAKKLVRDAIAAGIINDMGSGSNVDMAVIKPGDSVQIFRPYEVVVPSGVKKQEYKYLPGTTPVLTTVTKKMVFTVDSETVTVVPSTSEAMEVN